MPSLREAAQQALEALEYGQHTLKQVSENQWESRGQLAMEALKAALETQSTHSTDCYKWHHECAIAEVESVRKGQEPVAHCTLEQLVYLQRMVPSSNTIPLYTQPQPKAEPLTEEEIRRIVAAAEQDRCCRIVFGLCISDNNAQEIVDAIRGQEEKRSE